MWQADSLFLQYLVQHSYNLADVSPLHSNINVNKFNQLKCDVQRRITKLVLA